MAKLKEGEANIYIYDRRPNDTVISEKLFDEILYDYSVKLLEIYTGDKELPPSWKEEMLEVIKKLKLKVDKQQSN